MPGRFMQQVAGLAAKLRNLPHAAEFGVDTDTDQVIFKDRAGNVHAVASIGSVQSLSNKTLITPNLANPVITGAPSSALNIGTAAGGGVTEADDISPDGIIHHTVLTLGIAGANDIDLADGADNAKGKLLYTFPEGRIVILGAMIESEATVNAAFNANPNDTFYLGVGSADATQAADADLTGTEQDVIAKQTLDTVGGTDLDLDFDGVTSAPVYLDGRTTAAKLYLNAGVLNANTSGPVTLAVIGALKFSWLKLGDN